MKKIAEYFDGVTAVYEDEESGNDKRFYPVIIEDRGGVLSCRPDCPPAGGRWRARLTPGGIKYVARSRTRANALRVAREERIPRGIGHEKS